MVMVANNSGAAARRLATRHPGGIGHLYSPGGQRGPFAEFPYALDNGAYPAWINNREWDRGAWEDLMGWAWKQTPIALWALVPDVVGDREATLDLWRDTHRLIPFGTPKAFAAQDGMTWRDVPNEAEVVFLGGTMDWKGWALGHFPKYFPRIHVGRVNTLGLLDRCVEAKVESCDGTGWFRGDQRQLGKLVQFLEEQTNGSRPRLFDEL